MPTQGFTLCYGSRYPYWFVRKPFYRTPPAADKLPLAPGGAADANAERLGHNNRYFGSFESIGSLESFGMTGRGEDMKPDGLS